MRQLALFLRGRTGATALEYALVAALVGIVIISGATLLGQALAARFQAAGSAVTAVPSS